MSKNYTITIATGLKVNSKSWKNEKLTWGEFVDRLRTPVVTSETLEQFLKASKQEQGQIKDVGGYVGGNLLNGRRKPENVLFRQLITLDIDLAHKNLWDDVEMMFDGKAAVMHATHKSNPENLRCRLIMPLNREVSPEEYVAIARKVSSYVDINLFDGTTFQPERLMFWPSVPTDIDYYFREQEGEPIDADEILNSYRDWRDASEWPMAVNSTTTMRSTIAKQDDPCAKKGIVGVFCRTYTIQEAIDKFLQDIYIPATDGRYTFTKGSTAGGLMVYDDKFAYSHHSTDPACSRLCNAFDLVRIHKYGTQDAPNEKTSVNSKSYKSMEEFASKDSQTKRTIATEKLSEAKFDFIDEFKDTEMDISWTEQLDANTRGEYENSANNINIILQNDHMLKAVFVLNQFDNKRYITRSLPWRHVDSVETLRDVDYAGVRNYIETVYGVVSAGKIDDALALEFEKRAYHPIRDYLTNLLWDGKSRVSTLLVDYFGCESNAYTRAAIRKTLCGAVARVMDPGVKFDLVLTLVGGQGTGKSTFVRILGRDWFSDTFLTVQGKEALEQIQGAWLIEMAELSGLRKAEVETVKHFISKHEDMFRPAYGRVVETYKRQCIFIGTTNNKDFLRDPTGNRRFLPIDVDLRAATKNVFTELEDEVDQIWAEAFQMYKNGELLYLVDEEEELAQEEQKNHVEVDERKGVIEEYLDRPVPEGWASWDLFKRRHWLKDEDELNAKGVDERQYTCVAEVWCECLEKEKSEMTRYNTREINETLKGLDGWEFINSTKNFPIYGKQKYFTRKID